MSSKAGSWELDNITVLDRSEELPDGAILEQSDATGWMGFFCLHLMRMALELAKENRVYEGMATKFFEHFVYIGAAMKKMGGGATISSGMKGTASFTTCCVIQTAISIAFRYALRSV